MNVVDSSEWLEYFAGGPNASFFSPAIELREQLVVPTISTFEVFERLRSPIRFCFEEKIAEERSPMRYTVIAARTFLGGIFTFFGLNTFLWAFFGKAIVDPPAQMPAPAATFLEALTQTGFMNQLRGVVELTAGVLILSGICTPLGLVILAPVLAHILLYHHFLDPAGIGFSYFLVALELFLAYAYASAFRGILNPRARSRWGKQ